MLVGLTGGVGSGKSTVAKLFAEHGAVIIDADKIAREVVERGTPGYLAVLERFGESVVLPDGGLNRLALASIVFDDQEALDDLNAIVHPLVRARMAQLAAAVPPEAVVVYDVPLLAEAGGGGRRYDVVVVVEASVPVRLQRLAGRGTAESDARARIAAQASDEQRRAIADEIIVNHGTLEDLRGQVDDVWRRLVRASLDQSRGMK